MKLQKHMAKALVVLAVAFLPAVGSAFLVDDDLPAGNVIVDGIKGDVVKLRQDLRDSNMWFYWAFRVKGAAGRTLKFDFSDKTWGGPVGVRGPVVSTDGGKTFSYPLDGKSRTSGFTYTFGADENDVLFYECHPYVRANWESFVAKHSDALGKRFVVETLCKSRKGVDVPRARFGCIAQKPKFRIFMSARHHCSETMASWVLEGVGEAFLADDDLGRWLRANVELMMVPFVDYDGAQAGDQGKVRKPHDHNRDYSEFLYPETKAITEWIGTHAGGRLDMFLDIHCPWVRGKYNEWLYTPWKDPKILPDVAAEHRFSALLEKLQCGTMRYRVADDLPFGKEWNKGVNYEQGWSGVIWACHKVKGLKIARSYEVPFANANGAVVTPETCRDLGHDTAKVFRAFLDAGKGPAESAESILVECEWFENHGGWTLDAQFSETMGSPYLLAHGLGTPVEDATTAFDVAKAGEYGVWVRTKNWTAPWSATAAGTFEVKVDGTSVGAGGDCQGEAWQWQRIGRVRLDAGRHGLALHDKTGFDGRCDAVCLTAGEGVPERSASHGRAHEVRADVVVVGGGVAGICAAVAAARGGAKVALVQDRPVLGGNNSSEVRVHLGGRQNFGEYPRLGDVVAEIGPGKGGNAREAENYEDDRKLSVVKAEPNIALFLNTKAFKVEKSGAAIRRVTGYDVRTGDATVFDAPLFVDATGDGNLGALAGADFRMGRESRSETGEPSAPEKADMMTMGASVQWYAVRGGPSDFPFRPWMMALPEGSVCAEMRGDWDWETGFGRDPVSDAERIRDYGLLAVYSNWAAVKNAPKSRTAFADAQLAWVASVCGKRESRRLMGDVVLNENDIDAERYFPDATCLAFWSIDLHFPLGEEKTGFPGEPFRASTVHKVIKACPVPYRCLYSRNVSNLFMAGRNVSVTHVALGTTRVMRTTGMMGEVVGMAAAICVRRDCRPRDVYEHYLGELKGAMMTGAGKGRPQPPQDYNLGGTKGVSEKASVPPCVSGVYPHLAMFNDEGECGTGAVVPWAGDLWVVTYGPHCPFGSTDKLYRIRPDLTRETFAGSVGGTPANRMIHRETNQLLIGPYVIDAKGNVRVIPPERMPGRLTGAARHLSDPNRVYVATMETGLYELDMRTLDVNTLIRENGKNDKAIAAFLKKSGAPWPVGWESAPVTRVPGYHAKGLASGFGKVFVSNNGEDSPEARRNPFVPSGVLAWWNERGKDWSTIRRCQFAEVTTPDGIHGNEHPDSNPVWAMGWDAKSVILGVTTNGIEWAYYRLPKASHAYDGAHGWNTEWPRIRDVGFGDGTLLATMHGTFWRFPRTFSPSNPNGIRPISTYLKVIGDFCRWGDRIVFGCDDQAKNEFLGKRGLKRDAPRCERSQSNLWFVKPEELSSFGPPSGEGYVWLGEDVKAGDVSDPYFHVGYASMRFSFVRADGSPVRHELMRDGDWVRVKCLENAKGATARFCFGPGECALPALSSEEPIRVKDDNGKVWCFPNVNGDTNVVCREIATERDLLYVGGVWYEVPADNAGGFSALRPIALADEPVKSLCGERGLMYLNGKPMVIDDLWKNGTAASAYWLWRQ